MSAIILDECLLNLYEAEQLLADYKEIDGYSAIFEADNPEVKKQDEKNKEVKSGVVEHLKAAGNAILKLIRNLINSIKDFFAKRNLDKETRDAYDAFKAAAKKDPELKNKKITIMDFRKIQGEYEELLKEAEEAEKKIAEGRDPDVENLINRITKFCTNAGKGVAVSVGVEAALNIASSSTETAKSIYAQLQKDEKLYETLVSSIGEKETAKFEKEVKQLGKKFGLHRMVLNMRGKLATSYEDAIHKTISTVTDTISGATDVAKIVAGADGVDNVQKGKMANAYAQAKNLVNNSGEVAKAAKKIDLGMAQRVMGNDEIKNATKAALNTKADVEGQARQMYVNDKKAEKKGKWNSLVNKITGDQSSKSAMLGLNDENSSVNKIAKKRAEKRMIKKK